MITLEPLRKNQYRQVAEWDEQKPLGEDMDWDGYEREMSAPHWTHYGMYSNGEFVGAVSLEKIDGESADFHVTTARNKVNPYALVKILLNIARYLFEHGYTLLTATIPRDKRAAAMLARRCGMEESGSDEMIRRFWLTQARYAKNGIK